MKRYDNEPEQGMHGAEAVAHFLDRKHASYELIEHYATYAARDEASAAGSAAPRMAKTVVLHDTDGYRIAIIPASERVDLDKARGVFGASRGHAAGDRARDRAGVPGIRSWRSASVPGAAWNAGGARHPPAALPQDPLQRR